jgi:hypothetical protein
MHCMLTTTALTIGQLTGTAPRDAQIVYEAMHTPSVSRPGTRMYRGRKTDDRISSSDMRQLLANHGISTVRTTYPADGASAAVRDLSAALADPDKAALVALCGAVEGADSVEVVARVDKRGMVTLRDSDPSSVDANSGRPLGADVEIDAETFMVAWGAAGFELIVGEVTETPEPRSATWTKLEPRRESTDPAAVARLLHTRQRR